MNKEARLRRSQSCTTPAADIEGEGGSGYDRFGQLSRTKSLPKSRTVSKDKENDEHRHRLNGGFLHLHNFFTSVALLYFAPTRGAPNHPKPIFEMPGNHVHVKACGYIGVRFG